tara:strand:+ start:520 stop:846 length:327 start_codon:yes stop_codon:yes gene_type:complete
VFFISCKGTSLRDFKRLRETLILEKSSFFLNLICSFESFQSIFVFNKQVQMFDFDQYLGFLAFLTIFTIGFWLMIFLITFVVPYWLFGNIRELIKEKRKAKEAARLQE